MPHHRGVQGRGGHFAQLGGREVHGALRPLREGSGQQGRGLPSHDHGDPRGPRRRPQGRPHLPAPRPPAGGAPGGAPPRHLRDGGDLRWRRRHQGAHTCSTYRALQHGRHPNQPPRRGLEDHLQGRRLLRLRLRRPRAVRRRRVRVGVRPRREPARRQLPPRHRRLRTRVRPAHSRHRQARRPHPPPPRERRDAEPEGPR
mmetsp:Transcript_21167/g.44163  ORF Transcript_21167/g.44163 Transcript_21167/m.44163 type:complete len:200 (+) Transcript_21167:859-1458(+)